MNIRRVIWGPVLSLMFLGVFVYCIAGVNVVIGGDLQANLSGALDEVQLEEQPVVMLPVIDPNLDLSARAAVSVETNLEGKQKVLFEKNIDSVLPIASITKLMTAVVAIDNRTQQNIQLQMMIVGSSNEAANVLAGEVSNFVDLMNQKAREIGLEKTIFADPTGLSSQNISTVKDLAKFTEYILKNYPEIAQISKIKQLYVPRIGIIENTDQLLQEVPDAVCSKTGFTNDAKGCLLLVVRNKQNNDYLINIVLGADDRFVEMRKLISTCKQ